MVADPAVAEVGELPAQVRAVIDAAAEVYVVTPSLPGRLDWLTDDVDRYRHLADERLDSVLGHMRTLGVHASGRTGDDYALTALDDAVADFHPDHILIGLRELRARELAGAGTDREGFGSLRAARHHLCG